MPGKRAPKDGQEEGGKKETEARKLRAKAGEPETPRAGVGAKQGRSALPGQRSAHASGKDTRTGGPEEGLEKGKKKRRPEGCGKGRGAGNAACRGRGKAGPLRPPRPAQPRPKAGSASPARAFAPLAGRRAPRRPGALGNGNRAGAHPALRRRRARPRVGGMSGPGWEHVRPRVGGMSGPRWRHARPLGRCAPAPGPGSRTPRLGARAGGPSAVRSQPASPPSEARPDLPWTQARQFRAPGSPLEQAQGSKAGKPLIPRAHPASRRGRAARIRG